MDNDKYSIAFDFFAGDQAYLKYRYIDTFKLFPVVQYNGQIVSADISLGYYNFGIYPPVLDKKGVPAVSIGYSTIAILTSITGSGYPESGGVFKLSEDFAILKERWESRMQQDIQERVMGMSFYEIIVEQDIDRETWSAFIAAKENSLDEKDPIPHKLSQYSPLTEQFNKRLKAIETCNLKGYKRIYNEHKSVYFYRIPTDRLDDVFPKI